MTETIAETDTDQAVSVELVAERNYPWQMGQLITFLEGLNDLFWLAEGGEPMYEGGAYTYARVPNTVTLDGTAFEVRRLSLNSPLELTIDIVQHGGVYAASAAAIAASIVGVVRGIIDLRERWAASNAEISYSRMKQETYDRLRTDLALTPPRGPVKDPEELETRLHAAAESVLELRNARTT